MRGNPRTKTKLRYLARALGVMAKGMMKHLFLFTLLLAGCASTSVSVVSEAPHDCQKIYTSSMFTDHLIEDDEPFIRQALKNGGDTVFVSAPIVEAGPDDFKEIIYTHGGPIEYRLAVYSCH